MAHIVAEPCIKCKYTDCVTYCPVTCFHEGANMLVIDPDECIDCRVCVDVCPVQAIYPEDELPGKWHGYKKLNAELSRRWPVLTTQKTPLDTADEFKVVREKGGLLDESPGEGDPSP